MYWFIFSHSPKTLTRTTKSYMMKFSKFRVYSLIVLCSMFFSGFCIAEQLSPVFSSKKKIRDNHTMDIRKMLHNNEYSNVISKITNLQKTKNFHSDLLLLKARAQIKSGLYEDANATRYAWAAFLSAPNMKKIYKNITSNQNKLYIKRHLAEKESEWKLKLARQAFVKGDFIESERILAGNSSYAKTDASYRQMLNLSSFLATLARIHTRESLALSKFFLDRAKYTFEIDEYEMLNAEFLLASALDNAKNSSWQNALSDLNKAKYHRSVGEYAHPFLIKCYEASIIQNIENNHLEKAKKYLD